MTYIDQYEYWCTSPLFSHEIKKELEAIRNKKEEIRNRFSKELEFGTGGIRGVMGAGTNRMNRYTVARVTQGLANYLKENGKWEKGVGIAYDSRHMSREFAEETARCLAGNQIPVYLFSRLTPTPLLSFSILSLSLAAGIVITASHNPPEYNGYKVYWDDGAQITYPKDEEIGRCITGIKDYGSIKRLSMEEAEEKGLLHWLGDELEDEYIKEMEEWVSSPKALLQAASKVNIVYTPLHGTGNLPVRRLLSHLGFTNVFTVEEQMEPDGDFKTVKTPNPEEESAFVLALKLAKKADADLVLATDPDGDRMGVYVRDDQTGKYCRLTGNMTGILICNYLLSRRKETGNLPLNGAVIKTIVTTQMARPLAEKYKMKLIEVLTGFKYIGEQIKFFEESEEFTYQFGFEESCGCLVETCVRDKDAISAVMVLCEAAAYYKTKGSSLWEELNQLYEEFGYYQECLESVTLKGEDGLAQMNKIMETFRIHSPVRAGGFKIIKKEDYETGEGISERFPKSNVLRFLLSEDAWFAIRPSGTEPKIKFYFGVKGKSFQDADEKLKRLKKDILTSI
ncbi:phospho-sugar mutase [Lacrimispora xylanolytica]|uniref:Phosphoglucomutase n=1 Tax=Lacrimispora xylanolytica TaxID=29375 RepID=A0ABY7AE91_9FIRM|nr:phospho-sugar mutase [Lacrimispora xylanolytica]WAJ24896.1 phospho-sugar mutase [Lacrimispora xylanolytica]